jgi:hypothetical protein
MSSRGCRLAARAAALGAAASLGVAATAAVIPDGQAEGAQKRATTEAAAVTAPAPARVSPAPALIDRPTGGAPFTAMDAWVVLIVGAGGVAAGGLSRRLQGRRR